MPRKIIKRYLPDPNFIKNHKNLQFLGERLHDPNLWHLNRHSVALAFAIGLFFAWVPLPTQMAMAAAGAIFFRANLPISVALVWLTNPITMPPLFYMSYLVGLWALNLDEPSEDFVFSVDSVLSGVGNITGPFLTGCLILAITCSTAGYFGIQWYWRYHTQQRWDERKRRRAEKL
jgi:uncharacterized protein (DUF2062 family)